MPSGRGVIYDDNNGFESLENSSDEPIDVQYKVRTQKNVKQDKKTVVVSVKDTPIKFITKSSVFDRYGVVGGLK